MKYFEDYSKEYTCGGDRSYFTVSIPAEDEIKQYQIKMLENNAVDLILPLSVQRLNNDWKLYFDVTSKIPLSRVLERKPITQDKFLHIMLQIIKLTRELNDYLLDLSSVVFDVSYIFCDPSDLDLYFLYIPTELCGNEQEKLKAFLKKLLVEDINFSDDSSGVILKRLLEVLKEENFSIEQISKCILESKTERDSMPLVELSKNQVEVPISQVEEPTSPIEKLEKKPFSFLNGELKGQQNRHEIPSAKRNNLNNQQTSKAINKMENKTGSKIENMTKNGNNENRKENRFVYKAESQMKNNEIESGRKENIRRNGAENEMKHGKNQVNSNIDFGNTSRNGLLQVKPSYLIIGAIDIIMLVFFILIITSKSIGSTNVTGKITGMILVFASINYFLITRIAGKENGEKNNLKPENQSEQSMQSKQSKQNKQNIPAFKRFVNEEIEEDVILPQKPMNGLSKNNNRKGMSNEHTIIKSQATKEYEKQNQHSQQNQQNQQNLQNQQNQQNQYNKHNQHNQHNLNNQHNQQIPMIQQRIQQSAENFQKNYIKKPVTDKTVVLGKNSTPYLQNLTYPSDKIVLHKNSILIGRLEDSVDHVIQNNAVGKIHAELVEKDGEYCIIDLNSVNGTYVNGVRVLCNSATVINDGDKVTFANESYTYIG